MYKPCALPFGYRTLHFVDVQGSKYPQNYKEVLRALDIKRSDRETAEKAVLAKDKDEAAEKAAQEIIEKEAKENTAREKAKKNVTSQATFWVIGIIAIISFIALSGSTALKRGT